MNRRLRTLAAGCALLAALASGCSKNNGVAFDPDAGHPEDYLAAHPAEYQAFPDGCDECHGADLRGGISTVSCSTASRDGQSCHEGGPGGHPEGWRRDHQNTSQGAAAGCAGCHPDKGTPTCLSNTACHGSGGGHPAGWRTDHQSTSLSAAAGCAGCHPDKGTPTCLSNTACHNPQGNPHPPDWKDDHDDTDPGQAAYCHGCHQKDPGTPDCFNNTLCHGFKD